MNHVIRGFFLAGGLLGYAAIGHSQTIPICATASASIIFGHTPPYTGPITSATEIVMGIRQYTSSGDIWDFPPQNVVVSAFGIDVDARGQRVGYSSIPYALGSLGVLPAGSYTITVRPIATNVTPNVICPTFIVPLVVPQANENLSVPTISNIVAVLLAGILGLVGLSRLRHRRFRGFTGR